MSNISRFTYVFHGLIFFILCLILAASGLSKANLFSPSNSLFFLSFSQASSLRSFQGHNLQIMSVRDEDLHKSGLILKTGKLAGSITIPLKHMQGKTPRDLILLWGHGSEGIFKSPTLYLNTGTSASLKGVSLMQHTSPTHFLPGNARDRVESQPSRKCHIRWTYLSGMRRVKDPVSLHLHIDPHQEIHLHSITIR